MPFNIDSFRGSYNFDGARPNLFDINFSFPTGVGDIGDSVDLSLRARSAQLPGSTMGVVTVNYFGREIKLPGNRTFPEWTVTIINDEDFSHRNALELWMNKLNSHQSNVRDAGFLNNSDYSTDADVIQYGKTGDIIKKYHFVGLFPSDISPIDLDWGDNDQIEQYAVTFSYQYWETADENGTEITT